MSPANPHRQVVLTDYPDQVLVDNITHNVDLNIDGPTRPRVCVKVCYCVYSMCRFLITFSQGYIWGHPVEPLLEVLPNSDAERSFDLIIMSDLVFNHSQVRLTI